MREVPLTLGLMLLTILTGWEAFDFLVTNEGIVYFSSHPGRLLYVVGVGVVGGLLALAFSRILPVTRRALKIAALGGFAACVMAFLAVFAMRLASCAPMVTESGMWGWVIAALASLSAVVVLVWLEFRSVWKRQEGVA